VSSTDQRRQDPERDDCWFIYCGDIHAGTIAKAATVNSQAVWNWSAGFNPGSGPGEIKGGSADTFEQARARFAPAWLAFAASRTPEDFAEWRDQRDFTAWKYRMRDQGMPMPTQSHTGRARCFCGAEITTAFVARHIQISHRDACA
jgi:hypothetical protein